MKKKTAHTSYPVDKGIPFEPKVISGWQSRFPFSKMIVGDSFLIPKNCKTYQQDCKTIYTAVRNYNKAMGANLKIACRKQPNGLRVWRIKDKK